VKLLLALARKTPTAKLAPILIKHISFRPDTDIPPLRPIEDLNPAFGAALAIGPPAVKASVERLKKIDPETHEALLVLRLMIKIYDQDSFGPEMTMRRLELELAITKNVEDMARLQGAVRRLARITQAKGKI
jgi:hypothetical protein